MNEYDKLPNSVQYLADFCFFFFEKWMRTPFDSLPGPALGHCCSKAYFVMNHICSYFYFEYEKLLILCFLYMNHYNSHADFVHK